MSHVTGTFPPLGTSVRLGPNSGTPPTSPGLWAAEFQPAPAPGGTKLIVLHFRNVDLPGTSRLEVDLGYGTDLFEAGDGPEIWTRPINLAAFPSGRIPIRYVASGGTGGAEMDRYGRGERHAGDQDPSALSNCDPFLLDPTYVEPIYDPFWFCHTPPLWENVACIPSGDVRRRVARSCGMIMTKHSHGTEEFLSTCSVTLVDADVVITAGHCLTPEEGASGSVIFNYETQCNGQRPAGYQGRFHKVKRVLRHIWNGVDDYCLIQIEVPSGGLGIDPIPMRGDLPGPGEQIFGIHHPNGAVKKLAAPHAAFETVNSSSATGIRVDFDVSGGSSGSGLFDTAGRIVGVLSTGTACSLRYYPTQAILQQVAQPPGPPVSRDVAVVFDRSGSMAMAHGARTKIAEARDAASLFIQLIRSGAGNRLGLVSFSTAATAPPEFARAPVDAGAKNSLVGGPPFTGGIVGSLAPDAMTSIGGGLDAGRMMLTPAGANPRSILLMTDGLQNSHPMIAAVEGGLAGIDVNAIGFGNESSLNGALLTQLAASHGGLYTRAGSGLDLRKFFALAFGNIFEAGALFDPPGKLGSGELRSKPIEFGVCGEESITVVVGWDRDDAGLQLELKAPDGTVLIAGQPGVESATGRTWAFLRLALPFGSNRDGLWSAVAFRPVTGGEFPNEAELRIPLEYFISVIATGGPRLVRADSGRGFYTGDRYNPRVSLKYPGDAGFVRGGTVQLTVTRPDAAAGDLLSERQPVAPALDADALPQRQATLLALEAEGRSIGYSQRTLTLSDRPADAGTFEPSGVFGRSLDDLFEVEGNYTFHARAEFGTDCIATRELSWTVHVDVGIDRGRTEVRPDLDGAGVGVIVIVPRDRYGHGLGPGRGQDIVVSGLPGVTVTGPVKDKGGGVYEVPVAVSPGAEPGVVIGQPDRDPVVIGGGDDGAEPGDRSCLIWVIALLAILVLALLLALYLMAGP
ncbi:MAG TPA: vWA domain-containing protein [Allosphingosinicella sp.]|nr:vWA domain-containing protein [Allosphingosinicella sp.]